MKKILILSFMLVLLASCGNDVNDNKTWDNVNDVEVENNITAELTSEEEDIINEILEF